MSKGPCCKYLINTTPSKSLTWITKQNNSKQMNDTKCNIYIKLTDSQKFVHQGSCQSKPPYTRLIKWEKTKQVHIMYIHLFNEMEPNINDLIFNCDPNISSLIIWLVGLRTTIKHKLPNENLTLDLQWIWARPCQWGLAVTCSCMLNLKLSELSPVCDNTLDTRLCTHY